MGLICSRERPGHQQPQIQTPPPPYESTDSTSQLPQKQPIMTSAQDMLSNNSPQPVKDYNIQASSTPQWRWTNAQCRDWITLVLTKYSGKEPETARALAKQFKGFGPNLYILSWTEWDAWLGPDGQAIFAILMEVRDEKGAVPSTVEVPHYATRVIEVEIAK